MAAPTMGLEGYELTTGGEHSFQAVGEFRRALNLVKRGQRSAAAECFRRAVKLAPTYAEALGGLGMLLSDEDRHDEAVDCLRRAADLNPEAVATHFNLALALVKADRLDSAAASYRRVLQLRPDFARAHCGLALVLARQQRTDEAVTSYRRAITLEPNDPAAYFNLGVTLQEHDLDEAIVCFRRAIELNSQFVEAHYDLGVALVETNQLAAAAEAYRRAIELDANHAEAHLGYAIATLKAGRLAEAWAEYEWRRHVPRMRRPRPKQPQWHGEQLADRTLLVRSEQGLGDTLQFVRFLPQVKALGGTVILQCPRALLRLLQGHELCDILVADDEPLPDFDLQVSLLSLPGVFGTTLETIPGNIPYLAADRSRSAQWHDELAAEGVFKIGIAWQGRRQQPRDRDRSIPLWHFAAPARVPGVRLYSLQVGEGREQIARCAAGVPLSDLGPRLNDFGDTAAVAAHLDLIISCDSAPVHLAGALGVPVWVALPFAPDWRWMLKRPDSPWYPSMRLFRQTRRGDWSDVFERIAAELTRLVARRPGNSRTYRR